MADREQPVHLYGAPSRDLAVQRAGPVRRRRTGIRVPGDGRPQRCADTVGPAGPRLEPGRLRLAVQLDRTGPGLHLLPDPAHGDRLRARARRPTRPVARGSGQPGRVEVAVLPRGGRAVVDAGVPRIGIVVVRQRVCGICHGGGAGQPGQPDRAAAHPVGAHERGRSRPVGIRVRAGTGDDRGRRGGDGRLQRSGPPHREVAAMKRAVRAVLWMAFGLFFLFPLYAMADFSTRDLIAGGRTLQAWTNLVTDDALYQAIVISVLLAVFTVAAMLVVLVPTMIWVRLRASWARGVVEFLCLLPLTIPALVIVVGLRNVYLWVTYFLGESALTLTFVYVVLVLPFAYRAIDAALSAIDLKTLSEAARSLGAGWLTTIARVVVPNIWSGILSAAFISIAVVLGEYTIASLSGYETLQVQIVLIGKSDGPTSVAASLATLVFGFVLLLILALVTRGRRRPTAADPAVAAPTPATQPGVPT